MFNILFRFSIMDTCQEGVYIFVQSVAIWAQGYSGCIFVVQPRVKGFLWDRCGCLITSGSRGSGNFVLRDYVKLRGESIVNMHTFSPYYVNPLGKKINRGRCIKQLML